MIGHRGHPEVEGTMGQWPDGMYLVETEQDVAALDVKDVNQLAFVTQTTLSVDDAAKVIAALRARFPAITGPKKDDICYASQNRQDAVKAMAAKCDVIIVVGSPNSSNSNRLREVAEALGVDAYLVDLASDLQASWLAGKRNIGVTSGASAPEVLVKGVLERIQALGADGTIIELPGVTETVVFPLAKGLANTRESARTHSTFRTHEKNYSEDEKDELLRTS
jgi:4-hydroxy-3-methylbut-2-enyl diphosphate reductase